jgi:putative transposase
MRSITQAAVRESKAVRRQRERRLRLIQGGRSDVAPNTPPPDDPNDHDTRQPWERMLPVEEWT